MNVVHLTSAHSRYDSRIFQKECRSLAEASITVCLVVADGGGDEQKGGVKIVCADVKRGRFGRLVLTPFKILSRAIKLRADVYHFHDPELIPIALLLKLCGRKVVYDIHENVGLQLSTREWLPKVLRVPLGKVVDIFESFACRFFNATVVPQPRMKTKFEKYGKCYLVANFVDIHDGQVHKPEDKTKFIVFHAGGLTESRGLFSMLDVAGNSNSAKLVLAGRFENSETEQRARKHPAWNKISYLGVISKEEAAAWYAKTDLGLILYHNVGQYYLAYAIKLFEYMERGIPVIMPDFGDWADFCFENQCGVCVDVHDADSIAATIGKLQSSPELVERYGRAGRTAVEEKFNWKVAEKELRKLYKEMAT